MFHLTSLIIDAHPLLEGGQRRDMLLFISQNNCYPKELISCFKAGVAIIFPGNGRYRNNANARLFISFLGKKDTIF